MWVLKKARSLSKKWRRKSKTLDAERVPLACGHCHHCCHNICSNINAIPGHNICANINAIPGHNICSNIPGMPFPGSQSTSNSQPSAPPLPPVEEDWGGSCAQEDETESGSSEIGQGPMVYGAIPSYQQYMDPAPVYGVPIWPEMQPEWSTGLCHCEAHVPTCLVGFFCPCILFGKVAEELDGGLTSGISASVVWYILQQIACSGCVYSFGFRRKLRARYNLPEKPLPDWLVHCLCWSCAFCQEYRELNRREMREEAFVGRPIMAPPQHQSMTF